MKKILTAILIASTALIYSCGESTTPNILVPDTRQQVAGTHIYIIPPNGFAATETGFAKDDKLVPLDAANIVVMEMPGESYASKLAGLEENEKQQIANGAKVLSKEDVNIGKFKGKLLNITAGEMVDTYVLYFGDDSYFCIVIGTYSNKIPADGEAIKSALNSVIYR